MPSSFHHLRNRLRGTLVTSALLSAALAGCDSDAAVESAAEHDACSGKCDSISDDGGLDVRRASGLDDVPSTSPEPGTFRVHLIDVGTGLAILIQGSDFNMLFDGGSADDKRGIASGKNANRLVAYLFRAVGPSGPADCTPNSDGWTNDRDGSEITIDHLFLSHAHDDHNSLLDDVLHCYDVANVWEPGAINKAASHLDFLAGVAAEKGSTYHTAVAPHDDSAAAGRQIAGGTRMIDVDSEVSWVGFGAGQSQILGDNAAFTLLHASTDTKPSDFNETSLVVAVQLGSKKVLLVGDAESGPRMAPSAPVGDVEKFLLEEFPEQLEADILQVGHHGSKSSSRLAFLNAVKPAVALVSAGPKAYSGVVLPDREVIDALESIGAQVVRTDVHDGQSCAGKIGEDDTRPGGCDNHILELVGAPPGVANPPGVGDPKGAVDVGNCCASHDGLGCSNPEISACVCATDDFCCGTQWDETCVSEVASFGCGSCT